MAQVLTATSTVETLFPSRNLRIGVYLCAGGWLAVLVFSYFAGLQFFAVLAVSLAISLAALVLGLFLGFLFGIPRANAPAAQADAAAAAGAAGLPPPDHRVNTNLEDISDWLTKIIVGISLVELGNIAGVVRGIGDIVQGAFPAVLGFNVFTIALLVLYFMAGLLFGFLWTRLELQLAIGDADRSLLGKLKEKLAQENVEATLLELVRIVIQTNETLPATATLADAVRKASSDVRTVIFYRAREFRRNCRAAATLPAMERVIPIFEALIVVDKESGGKGRYHRNYAQLGYTMKDIADPAYDRALELLSNAIELRDTFAPKERDVYLKYEYNRAFVRIRLDANFKSNAKAGNVVRDAVLVDLNAALKDPLLQQWAVADTTVMMAWLALNDLKIEGDKISPI